MAGGHNCAGLVVGMWGRNHPGPGLGGALSAALQPKALGMWGGMWGLGMRGGVIEGKGE